MKKLSKVISILVLAMMVISGSAIFALAEGEMTEETIIELVETEIIPEVVEVPEVEEEETVEFTVSFRETDGSLISKASVIEGGKLEASDIPEASSFENMEFDAWTLNGAKFDLNGDITADIDLTASYTLIEAPEQTEVENQIEEQTEVEEPIVEDELIEAAPAPSITITANADMNNLHEGDTVTLTATLNNFETVGEYTLAWQTRTADGEWHDIEGENGLTLVINITLNHDDCDWRLVARMADGE